MHHILFYSNKTKWDKRGGAGWKGTRNKGDGGNNWARQNVIHLGEGSRNMGDGGKNWVGQNGTHLGNA